MAIEYGELNVDCLWEPGQGYTGFTCLKSMHGLRHLNWKGRPVNIVSEEVLCYDGILTSCIKVCVTSNYPFVLPLHKIYFAVLVIKMTTIVKEKVRVTWHVSFRK